jgi:hypothetical protein
MGEKVSSIHLNIPFIVLSHPPVCFRLGSNGDTLNHVRSANYREEGEKFIIGKAEFNSHKYPQDIKEIKMETVHKVVDGKLHISGRHYTNNKLRATWTDLMERIEPKSKIAKTTSTK